MEQGRRVVATEPRIVAQPLFERFAKGQGVPVHAHQHVAAHQQVELDSVLARKRAAINAILRAYHIPLLPMTKEPSK